MTPRSGGVEDLKDSPESETGALPAPHIYLGIFLISSSTLLFQLALTRIFAVVLWGHMAFMVVGSALFGFGLSGVYLALSRKPANERASLAKLSLYLGLAMVGTYFVISLVPLKIWNFNSDWLNYPYLAAWYIACVLPFFVAGQIIARILNDYPLRSSRLYGADLIGSAVGSVLLIPVIGWFGGVGTLMASALLAALAALTLSAKQSNWMKAAAALCILLFGAATYWNEKIFPIQLHNAKRDYKFAADRPRGILATRWSTISRVDFATFRHNIRKIWIDGGTNESGMYAWDGKLKKLKPKRWLSIGTAYELKTGQDPKVMVIGPAGGLEVLFALSHGARHVDAVELDPSIVSLLNKPRFSKFIGNLYKKERVNFVNDEGRAFLRRQPKGSYDVIQFVNNYTPVAMASGALNLSETFLLTTESFRDFFEALTPNGILALHRGATLRVAMTALAALRELGVENPASHLLIMPGERRNFEGFYMKRSPWTKSEIEQVYAFMNNLPGPKRYTALWDPSNPGHQGIYSRVISAPEDKQKEYYTSLGINLFPATDNSPFMEHYLQFGRKNLSKDIPFEFRSKESKKIWGMIPNGDFPYLVILAESALLAFLFVLCPLGLWARSTVKNSGFKHILGYFACLGFGFIVIEICLMKRYVLFLGNPAYSITTTLVALLLGAGLGSTFSQRLIDRPARSLKFVLPIVLAAILTEILLAPIVFQTFLHLSFIGRVLTASALLLPLGFAMGMPFPLGLQLIKQISQNEETRSKMVAWAWGINGYMTVVGSALAVFIALFWGFKSVLAVGMATYFCALLLVLGLAGKRLANS